MSRVNRLHVVLALACGWAAVACGRDGGGAGASSSGEGGAGAVAGAAGAGGVGGAAGAGAAAGSSSGGTAAAGGSGGAAGNAGAGGAAGRSCPEPYTPPVGGLPACEVTFDSEITRVHGFQQDGSFIDLRGRRAVAAGPRLTLGRLPEDLVLHPSLNVAYVTNANNEIAVVDTAGLSVIETIDGGGTFGLELAPDASRLYAGTYGDGGVKAWVVNPVDGRLTAGPSVALGGRLGGLELSADGTRLWAVVFKGKPVVHEVDVATFTATRTIDLSHEGWELLHLPSRDELYVSNLHGETLSVVDLSTGTVAEEIPISISPAGLERRPDDSVVWVAVSGGDSVVAIDTVTRSITDTAQVAQTETDLVTAAGDPLPSSNVNAIHYNPSRNWLLVSRGSDNMVTVLDADTLAHVGDIPSDRYPNRALVASDDRTLAILAWKGGGVPPDGSHNQNQPGSIAFVDLDNLNLAAATQDAARNYRRLLELFPAPACEFFPLPTAPGQQSPIEHVILIVKENRTFDSFFGELDLPGVERDASLADYTELEIPNQYALARQFVLADNFYYLGPESDTGHLYLTATHMSEHAERFYVGHDLLYGLDELNGQLVDDEDDEEDKRRSINLFTHLYDSGVDVDVYGETVNIAINPVQTRDGQNTSVFNVNGFPGGSRYNTAEPDVNKARFVAERIQSCQLAQFSYVLLPNDHTEGGTPGSQTPRSYVADNDNAVGIIVDALAKSPYWTRSVVFILEDDTQGGNDHISEARGFVFTVSPWAKRGYVSKVASSYLNVFATIYRIFGAPAIGRPEASVPPLWDHFTNDFDPTGYDEIPRNFPMEFNPAESRAAAVSKKMDFSGPDRAPELEELLAIMDGQRRGRVSALEAEQRLAKLEQRLDKRLAAEAELEEQGVDLEQRFVVPSNRAPRDGD